MVGFINHARVAAILLALGLIIAGCAVGKPTDAPFIAAADAAAHNSLDAANGPRVAKALEPLKLQSDGIVPNDTLDGRPVLVAFYSFDPPYTGGHFTVYVFKDNREVRVMVRD